MSAVTLADLRADFDDLDLEIADAMDNCIAHFERGRREQGEDLIESVNRFFDLLVNKPAADAAGLSCYLLGEHRITFNPYLVTSWDAHSDRCQDYVLDNNAWPGDGWAEWHNRARKAGALYRIASSYDDEADGLRAAMLFKLSGGNIDPRVSA